MGRMFDSVCLFVCLSVCLSFCLQHNSKTNDPTLFKLGVKGMTLDILEMIWFWFERTKVKVTESISAFFTLMTITPMLNVNAHLTDNSNTVWV